MNTSRHKILFISFRNIASLNSGDKIASYSFLKTISKHHSVHFVNILDEGNYSQSDIFNLNSLNLDGYHLFSSKRRIPFVAGILSLFFLEPYMFSSKGNRRYIKDQIDIIANEYLPKFIVWDHLRSTAFFSSNLRIFFNVLIQHNNETELYKQRANEAKYFRKLFLKSQAFFCSITENYFFDNFYKVLFISKYDLSNSIKDRSNIVVLDKLKLDFFHRSFDVDGLKAYDLLFIGSLDWEPNIDAVLWFVEFVFPLLPENTKIAIVGRNPSEAIKSIKIDEIDIYSNVPSVEEFYLNSKVFISPMRLGGGINIKIFEALSYGIPIVGTPHSFRGFPYVDFLNLTSDPRSFSSEIVRLLNDPIYYDFIHQSEVQYYNNYNHLSEIELIEAFS